MEKSKFLSLSVSSLRFWFPQNYGRGDFLGYQEMGEDPAACHAIRLEIARVRHHFGSSAPNHSVRKSHQLCRRPLPFSRDVLFTDYSHRTYSV
jgi:hypothetical protein